MRSALAGHQAAADAQFEALHASQKALTRHLRALLNALDAVAHLPPPRADAARVEQLRAAAAGARALAARLRGVGARMDRVEAALADLRARGALPPAAAGGGGGGGG